MRILDMVLVSPMVHFKPCMQLCKFVPSLICQYEGSLKSLGFCFGKEARFLVVVPEFSDSSP